MLSISLVDYGVGNLFSLKNALENSGAKVEIVSDIKKILDANCIAFPGVGAFDKTMEKLLPYKDELNKKFTSGTSCIAICIGAQILMEKSEEGSSSGIGFIHGKVKKMSAKQLPHVGWNFVKTDDNLLNGIEDRYFYFTHSFYCQPSDENTITGTTEYEGKEYPIYFRKNNVVATQFHPEKSSSSGFKFLKNFIEFAEGLQ